MEFADHRVEFPVRSEPDVAAVVVSGVGSAAGNVENTGGIGACVAVVCVAEDVSSSEGCGVPVCIVHVDAVVCGIGWVEGDA